MEKGQVGWIIDTPTALIKTKKSDLIIDKSSSGEVTFSGDNLEIFAGQGFLALAQIPKSTKVDVKISNAEFSLDQMEMTSGGSVTIGAKEFSKYGDIFVVEVTNKITIPEVVIAGSVRINGFKEVTTVVATGEFKVTIATEATTLQFFTDVPTGTEMKPSYKILTAATVAGLSVKTTDVPGSAEVTLTWPIYESEEIESAIWADGQLVLFKAKINQSSKIGGGYKSAQTFDINFSTLDAKRPDKKAWDFNIIPRV
jgi:hypothetical protein